MQDQEAPIRPRLTKAQEKALAIRRGRAKAIVAEAGFAPWRKLIDSAEAMLANGLNRLRIVNLLKTGVRRLPCETGDARANG